MAQLRELFGEDLEHVELPEVGWVYRLRRQARGWRVRPAQVLALAVGARAMRFLSGARFSNEIEPVLEQLRQAMRAGETLVLRRLERKIHITSLGDKPYHRQEDRQEVLGEVVDGLLYEKPLELTYLSHKRRGEGLAPRELTVHPLSMVFHRGGVYFVVDVVQGDLDRDDGRILLALDRIGSAAMCRGSSVFEYPADFDPDDFFGDAFGIYAGGDLIDVTLAISATMAPYVREREWHPTEVFEEGDDGRLLMRFQVRGELEVVEWVLGMGEHAEVLAPASLRETVRRRLEGALRHYR